jgi:hypothetical protein
MVAGKRRNGTEKLLKGRADRFRTGDLRFVMRTFECRGGLPTPAAPMADGRGTSSADAPSLPQTAVPPPKSGTPSHVHRAQSILVSSGDSAGLKKSSAEARKG